MLGVDAADYLLLVRSFLEELVPVLSDTVYAEGVGKLAFPTTLEVLL